MKQHMVFGILLMLYSFVTLFLFHRQSVAYDGRYTSDMLSYVAEVQGIDSGFSFPYPIYFWVGRFFTLFTTPQHGLALATLLSNDLAAEVLYVILLTWGNLKDKSHLAGVLTFALLLVSMVYPLTNAYLSGEAHRYLGVFTPNPYHNGTYLAARAFMLLALFAFVRLLDHPEEEKYSLKDSLFFALWLLLATMTKPSFTLIFGVAAIGILLIRLIRGKGKNIKQVIWLSLLFVPTILDLIYQYAGVFLFGNTGDLGAESLGVGFGFAAVWGNLTESIPIAVFRGILFPLVIAICYPGAFRITWYRLSWGVYLAGLLSALCLYEKGYRMMHMNFAWGYMAGMFLVFLTALMVLIMKSRQIQSGEADKKRGLPCICAGWLTFFCHLICGIIYFGYLCNGGLFH